MEICNDSRHEEIVYSGREACPLCSALDEINSLKDQNEELTDEVRGLKAEVDDLNKEIDSLNEVES